MNEDDTAKLPITDPKLQSIADELAAREPIFHNPEFGVSRADLERQTAVDYWEVGASGKPYSHRLVLDTVERRFAENTEADTSGWQTSEFYCRELGPQTYLLTYLLDQDGRISRRMTIWRHSNQGWQILYHQGTLVA